MDSLVESGERLEAEGITIAVNNIGDARIIATEADAHTAVLDGFVLYTARDMYVYVTLSEIERQMMHDFKRLFGGVWSWSRTA